MNREMLFEDTVRLFLGDKRGQIAGQVNVEKHRKNWFRKVLKKVINEIHKIETNTTHQERLAHWSECSLSVLKQRKFDELILTLCLLRLVAVLLGFVGQRPYRVATPVYFQTKDQHFTAELIGTGGDDYENSVAVRKRLIDQLKDEGKTTYEISLILNTSEREVQKLRKEL